MPNDEKIEDFVSLWKKKKTTEKPSVIGETLDKLAGTEERINELEKENVELKEKIKENIELISKTERVIKEAIQEKEQLKKEKEQALKELHSKLDGLESEKVNFNAKIKSLEDNLQEKERELVELKKIVNPELTQPGSQTVAVVKGGNLESLCQDLQTELNKYKRVLKELKDENAKLKSSVESGTVLGTTDMKTLEKENESLKKQISEMKKSIEKKSIPAPVSDKSSNKIKELHERLKEKDDMISKLKSLKPSQTSEGTNGPITDLVEDLQGKINKLKTALKEKNKIIQELKNK